MNASQLLDKHIGLCTAHARGWLAPVLRAAHGHLLSPGHASTQGLPRAVVAQAVELLQARGGALADAFERELGRQLRADVPPSRTSAAASEGPPARAEWKLVDEDEAAEEVEVVRTIQLVEGGAEWELRDLQARTATLRGQTSVSARSNPLRPEVVARSLWAAAGELGLTGAARRALLRAASEALTPAMQRACRDAAGWLAQWGIEPAAWKVSSVASGRLPGPPPSGFDVTRAGALDALRAVAADGAGAAPGRNDAGRATESLLATLFERLLDDPRVAPPVLARIGRLQPTLLRAAQAEPALLDDPAHPAWRLINRVATQALGYDDVVDPRLQALLAQLDPWVAAVAAERQPNTARLAEALAALEAICLAHLRAEQKSLGGSIERLRRAEREAEAAAPYRACIEGELSTPAARANLSPLLREFFLGPWCEAVARAAARDGAGAVSVERLAALPRALVATLQPAPMPVLRAEVLRQLPALAATLQEGLGLTTLPLPRRQAVTDELLERHAELLKGAARPNPPGPSPEEIVRRLREEPVEPAGVDPRLAPPSVIDEGHLDTLPADLADAAPAAASLHWLEGAQPGLWCHLFAQESWRAARLIWVSEARAHWLFVSDPGVTHSLTMRAVDRLAREGLLAPLEARNLIERAIDGLLAARRPPA